MKKLAIALSIFPGSLFVIAVLSYAICAIAERNLPPGGADIGMGLILLAAMINIPTIVVWWIYLARRRGDDAPQAGDPGKRKRWVSVVTFLATAAVFGVLSAAAIAAYERSHQVVEVNRVFSLDEWEKRTRLAAFTLLDRAELPGYYICVYDTGLREIAFCYHRKNPEAADTHSFAVRDVHGEILQDPARWNKASELNRPGDTDFIEGMVIPIKPDHHGSVDLEFKVDRGAGYESVYKKRLPYDGRSEQGGAR